MSTQVPVPLSVSSAFDDFASDDDAVDAVELGSLGHQVADRLIERGAFLPVLLRVEDVARFLQVKVRAVRKMIYERKLPAVKTGRSWVIPRDAWLRHVEQQAMRQRDASPSPHRW